MLMFVGVPAWTAMIALAALKPFDPAFVASFPVGSTELFYIVFLVAFFSPRLAGFADILLTKGGVARYGGGRRFGAGALSETLFSCLLCAVTTWRTGLFMIGLLFGRTAIWNGQARDAHALSFATAARGLWQQTLFGVIVLAVAGAGAPSLVLWSLPVTLGYVLALPFAILTASPKLSAATVRIGLCALPEEIDRPEIFATLERAIGKASGSGAASDKSPPVFEPA